MFFVTNVLHPSITAINTMKKLLPTVLIAISCLCSASAFAADGRITMSGSIDAVTCSVRGGSGSNGGSGDFTVTLDSVPQSKLANQGDVAGAKRFDVVVGGAGEVGCTNGKVARLTFDAAKSPVDAMSKRLRNDSGTAKYVLIGLADDYGSDIDLTNNTNSPSATISGNTATLSFIAYYYAQFTGLVTPGTVETYVMYSINYN